MSQGGEPVRSFKEIYQAYQKCQYVSDDELAKLIEGLEEAVGVLEAIDAGNAAVSYVRSHAHVVKSVHAARLIAKAHSELTF